MVLWLAMVLSTTVSECNATDGCFTTHILQGRVKDAWQMLAVSLRKKWTMKEFEADWKKWRIEIGITNSVKQELRMQEEGMNGETYCEERYSIRDSVGGMQEIRVTSIINRMSESQVVHVVAWCPLSSACVAKVQETLAAFFVNLQNADYNAVRNLFVEKTTNSWPDEIFAKLRKSVNIDWARRVYYPCQSRRLLVNGEWYSRIVYSQSRQGEDQRYDMFLVKDKEGIRTFKLNSDIDMLNTDIWPLTTGILRTSELRWIEEAP